MRFLSLLLCLLYLSFAPAHAGMEADCMPGCKADFEKYMPLSGGEMEDEAEKGDPTAQYLVCLTQERGLNGYYKNPEAAFGWCEKAAAAGLLSAKLRLAQMYDQGIGRPRDAAKANALIHEAAESGLSEAQFRLAMVYLQGGMGITKPEPKKAVDWLRKAAAGGHEDAKKALAAVEARLAEIDPDGTIGQYMQSRDEDRAAVTAKAESGDIGATTALCEGYRLGKNGYPEDFAEGFKWCLKAAEAGQPYAQLMTAQAYIQGEGVPADPKKGRDWLVRTAKNNVKEAQYLLGSYYKKGDAALGLTAPDLTNAVFWLESAAKGGHKAAKIELANLYIEGRQKGLAPDYGKAVAIFKTLTDEIPALHLMIAQLYYVGGPGLDADWTRALRAAGRSGVSFEKAHERQNVTAEQCLNDFRREGYLVCMMTWHPYDEGDACPAECKFELFGTCEQTCTEMKRRGDGFAKDNLHDYKAAAESGDGLAQFFYASKLMQDKATEAEALRWMQESANQDFVLAQGMMALAYSNGLMGLKPDTARTEEWLKRAAAQGRPDTYAALIAFYGGDWKGRKEF